MLNLVSFSSNENYSRRKNDFVYVTLSFFGSICTILHIVVKSILNILLPYEKVPISLSMYNFVIIFIDACVLI